MSKNTSSPKKTKTKTDLADSADDKKHLQPDSGTLDLPDVKDIPGQEKIRPLLKGELGDITASSDDEEGKDILDDNDDLDTELNSNVTKDERDLLQKSAESLGTDDDLALENVALDDTDEDGTPLNENDNQSGKDLDVPDDDDNSTDDDSTDEDEENDSYSLSDDKEDDTNTRQ